MKYENRVIIYLDILGFKDYINHTSKTILKKEEKLDALYGLFNFLQNLINEKEAGISITQGKRVTFFSDLIVISFPASDIEAFQFEFHDIQVVIANCITRGFLIRGAIVYGDVIHTDSIIFGPGLINAYEFEKEISKYPRVIIEKAIIEDWIDSDNSVIPMDYIYSIDADGEYFIDYFSSIEGQLDNPEQYWLLIMNLAKILRKMRFNPHLKEKFEWLHNKYYVMLCKAGILKDIKITSYGSNIGDFVNNDYEIYDWIEVAINDYKVNSKLNEK